MRWVEFEQAEPEMAALAREELQQNGVMVMGTIRRDGSPRISMIEPWVVDGDLYLGMMWQSRKAIDLLRDPRLALHNAVCTSTGNEVEISLRGRATSISEPQLRKRYVDAVSERITWKEPHFHLFLIELESASLIRYERGEEQSVRVWPQGTRFKRPYSQGT